MGWLKTNVDASFIAEAGTGATRVIIRNHNGTILLAGGNTIASCSTAEEAEALAIVDGAKMSALWPDAKVIFKSDCSAVVNAVNLGRQNSSHLRSNYFAFLDATDMLTDWKCLLATRNQNLTAHECAACVRQVDIGVIWNSLYPDRISKAATLDCNRTSHASS